MKEQDFQVGREFSKFVQAFWVELPLAAANRLWGEGSENTLRGAGWKAYDAFVSLANEATNLLYADRGFATLTGRTIEQTLQIQHMSGAAAAAFFGNLWPAVGLPTAKEVAGLRSELAAMREELGKAVATTVAERPEGPATAGSGQLRMAVRAGQPRRHERSDENAAA
jgi:hypothetical protein